MKKKKAYNLLGFGSAAMGVFFLFYVIYPIFSYELSARNKFVSFLSPVPESERFVYAKEEGVGEGVDYTKVSNWFVGKVEGTNSQRSSIMYYTLTIPALRIKEATVAIGGEDLSKSLIQYPGTGLPGKRGNAVIFGHSILPQFYNPKEYLSIFSLLPTLEPGDEIFLTFDGISYRYEVEILFEVQPTDIQILEQNSSGTYLTLVTCTPPGHPLRPRRLIVRAKLATFNDPRT